jgi:type 1 fimbria pilin
MRAILGAVVCGSANTVMAGCTPEQATVIRTMPLIGANLTVGRDVPLGTVVFKQSFRNSTGYQLVCTPGEYPLSRARTLAATPLPVTGWSGGDLAGKVYQTGVAGIGVYLASEGRTVPDTSNFINCGGGVNICRQTPQLGFDVLFIKIGDVSPGTIQGVQLPTLQADWISPTETTTMQLVDLSGTINVVSRTCDTPDVDVPMGSHPIFDFKGVGSATQWKNLEIVLSNCPAFYGIYPGNIGSPVFDSEGQQIDNGRAPNVLAFRLDPTDGVIDAGQGIIALRPVTGGGDAEATGVGIQIGVGHTNPAPVVLSTLQPSGITPTQLDGASYSIPLSARYIQTGDTVTAGPANGSVVFTINYQ